MRGQPSKHSQLFHYVSTSVESFVPADHPLREVRRLADQALQAMSRHLSSLYSKVGRPSIPPEHLLRALLLQALYSIRSERQLVEQLHYNLLYRWFVGLELESEVWDFSTFSQNRERFLSQDTAVRFQQEIVAIADAHHLLSRDHFTVDGTLIEAATTQRETMPSEPVATASQPSSQDDDPGNPSVDFHRERRTNATHRSTTDPEARLYRKGRGKEAHLAFLGHVLMENRHGLIVDACVTPATGTAERDAAKQMLRRLKRHSRRHITVGADKGYDTAAFVATMRAHRITPHIAAKGTTTLDGRTFRHAGYAISQRKRKLVEEIFGWCKTIARVGKARFRGVARIGWAFGLTACAYNLLRIAKLVVPT